MSSRKRVLLVSVKFMSLYQDIINELERQGYEVSFMEDVCFERNYYNLRCKGNKYLHVFQGLFNKFYWRNKIKKNKIDYKFDYFICIDGFSLINSGFIEFLMNNNPSIKKILYLYDRTYENYRFDLLFPLFDNIYSFDIKDCQVYGLNLLPIYWIPTEVLEKKIDIFGFGTYMENRYQLFLYVDSISNDKKLNSFIKLYIPEKKQDVFSKIRRIRGGGVPDKIYKSHLITHLTIPPNLFRDYIASSNIVLDTHDIIQDGLTARFMWALGAGAKIITTNEAAKHYPFYNEEMIKIVDVNNIEIPPSFFDNSKCYYDNKIVNQYRIDNWVKTLLS